MSLAKRSCIFCAIAAFAVLLGGLVACGASSDAEEIAPSTDIHYGSADSDDSGNGGSKDSGNKGSGNKKDSTAADSLGKDSSGVEYVSLFSDGEDGLGFVYIPTAVFNRGSIQYTITSFFITTTEVTQALYKGVLGTLPDQDEKDDSLPVVNVSWYDAVLFCNALSKIAGLDTVYSYKSIGDENFLDGLQVDYSVEGIRLPTEMEWEVAAHGGVYETANYWGSEPASKYAYYGQTKGPSKVAQFIPNDFGLYDMAGNVAEWVNDWYASYSTDDEINPVGPETGKTKCVRGGGWADKVSKIAPKERDKKDPLYSGVTLGFRIVYTKGF